MEPAANSVQKFCDAWNAAFAGVLESLGAPAVTGSWSVPLAATAAPVLASDSMVTTRFQVSKSLQGSAAWLCEKSVAVQFAQLLQSEALDPAAEFSEINRDAFAEFFRQVAGQVATDWKAETGVPIDLTIAESPEPPATTGAQAATLELKSEKFGALALQLVLDPLLCAGLLAMPLAEEASAPAASSAAESADPAASLAMPPNLALLLDVELEATIRFGQRNMLLREVFGLMPGTVVELDQLVNEPAELLVAGRLIARGEVVVVDGNFGLRVSEVAAANQRAALLDL
jgi:flagellar motor switch protein FliN/FliY